MRDINNKKKNKISWAARCGAAQELHYYVIYSFKFNEKKNQKLKKSYLSCLKCTKWELWNLHSTLNLGLHQWLDFDYFVEWHFQILDLKCLFQLDQLPAKHFDQWKLSLFCVYLQLVPKLIRILWNKLINRLRNLWCSTPRAPQDDVEIMEQLKIFFFEFMPSFFLLLLIIVKFLPICPENHVAHWATTYVLSFGQRKQTLELVLFPQIFEILIESLFAAVYNRPNETSPRTSLIAILDP